LKRNVAYAAVDCEQQNKVDEIAFGTERAFTGQQTYILITFTCSTTTDTQLKY